MKYLLPCSCGKSVAVEAAQAGQRVCCTCGRMLDVPTMRLVRQLPPADRAAAGARRPAPTWPLAQRLLFACGLVVLLGGAATAAYCQWIRSQLYTQEYVWDDVERACAEIAKMNIDAAWTLWADQRDQAIGPYEPPVFIVHRHLAALLWRYVLLGFVAAGAGLGLMVLAAVLRPGAVRARPRAAAGDEAEQVDSTIRPR